MIRRTHHRAEYPLENLPHDGLKASVADLLESLHQARIERDQAHRKLRQRDQRIDGLHNQLNRQQRRIAALEAAVHEATKPRRRQRQAISDQQISFDLERNQTLNP